MEKETSKAGELKVTEMRDQILHPNMTFESISAYYNICIMAGIQRADHVIDGISIYKL